MTEPAQASRSRAADGRRERLSKEDRRRQLVAAARTVFLRTGPSARVRDIAEAAGVNEALLYQHFRSKEELFDAAVLLPLEEVVNQLAEQAGELPLDASASVQYEATVTYYRQLLAALVDSVSLLGVVLFSDHDAGRSFYLTRLRPVIDTVVEVVRNNLPSWPHRHFDPFVVTNAGFGMCLAVALDASFTRTEVDVDEIARQLTDMIFFGLATPGEDGSVTAFGDKGTVDTDS